MLSAIKDTFMDRQFMLYAVIGVSGVLLDIVTFFIMTAAGVPAALATVVSVSLGIINNFLLNRKFNFKRTDHPWRRFAAFYAVGATGVLISVLLLALFHDIIGTGTVVAKLVSVPVIVAFQYWFNKRLSFAEKAGDIPVRQLVVFAVCMVVLVVSAINGPHNFFSDEHDNLLGGKVLFEGGVLYRNYFSHHMPLPYFAAAPFYAVFGDNLIAAKTVFGLLCAVWLLVMSRHIFRRYGLGLWAAFVLLLSISQTYLWTSMFLAETFIAYAMLHVLLLFWTREDRRFTSRTSLAYAALAGIPALSSASYIWLSLLSYILMMVNGWQWFFASAGQSTAWRNQRLVLARLAVSAALCAVPFIVFAGYLILTHSLGEFRAQAFAFNTLYYSQFVDEVGKGFLDSLFIQAQAVLHGLYAALLEPEWGKLAMRTALVVTLLLAGIMTFFDKKWLPLTVLGGAFLGAAAVRNGFLFTFLPGRSGVAVGALGVAMVLLYLGELQQRHDRHPRTWYESVVAVMLAIFLTVFAIAGADSFIMAARDYHRGVNQAAIKPDSGVASVIINTVNDHNQYYWAGPIEFYTDIMADSRMASRYAFYMPWHAACPACKAGLLNDLQANRPNVVYWNDASEHHGFRTSVYGKDIGDFLSRGYYRAGDERLKFFYFDSANRAIINQRLTQAGYKL